MKQLKQTVEKGFTLIEAMATMVIVSIGLLALSNLLITSIRVNQENEFRIEASETARSVASYLISQIRNKTTPWDQAAATAAASALVGPNYTVAVTFSPNAVNNCQYTYFTVDIGWTLHEKPQSVKLDSGAMNNQGGC